MNPRAVWTGDVAVGQFKVPIRIFKATDDDGVSFKLVHAGCGGAIRYKKVCEVDELEVPQYMIARGLTFPDGQAVVFSGDELEQLLPISDKVLNVITAEHEGPELVAIDGGYWIAPETKNLRAYQVLISAMRLGGWYLYGTLAIRKRPRNCVIWEREGQLALSMLAYPSQVRAMPEVPFVEAREDEVGLAIQLLELLKGEIPATDPYRDAIIQAVAKKDVIIPPALAEAQPMDIMEALKASIAAKAKKSKKPAKKRVA